jgi:hypothetical protein
VIVYGDHRVIRAPRAAISALRDQLTAVAAMTGGLARHAALVSALIDAAAIAQGVADAALAAVGVDAPTDAGDAAMDAVMAIAHAVARSWQAHVHAPLDLRPLDRMLAADLGETIELSRPEGYCFYALYPEAYLVASVRERLRRPGPRHVIGIRSIGTGLAAMVAVGAGAPRPTTVRPRGHPFDRRIDPAPALVERWRADPEAVIAVADEGPGLSGSSFGAVADVLEACGVDHDHLELYPSHGGDVGPEAPARHRARWSLVRRPVVDVDQLLLDPAAPRLATWVADRVGPLTAPLEDISGGRWRAHHYRDQASWPPACVHQERRKLLATTSDATWLVKFVGLGRHGEHATARARELAAAGFGCEVAGLCHGFLVERWRSEARPLSRAPVERRILIDAVGRYLAFRARHFAAAEPGSSLSRLVDMAAHNRGRALGVAVAAGRWRSMAVELEPAVVAIETDNRLHAWEWLTVAGAHVVKTDAVDHHADHDLVGCQDVAWDVAAARIELGLSPNEGRRLAAVVEHESGRALVPGLLALAAWCYPAFQLGRYAMAAAATADRDEVCRLRDAEARYRHLVATT